MLSVGPLRRGALVPLAAAFVAGVLFAVFVLVPFHFNAPTSAPPSPSSFGVDLLLRDPWPFDVRNRDLQSGAAKGRVCFATQEFRGMDPVGGIGKAFLEHAQLAATAGYEVTVIYPRNPACGSACVETTRAELKGQHIELVWLWPLFQTEMDKRWHGSSYAKNSYAVFQWLFSNARACDVVYFHDYSGLGFYSILAQRVGIEPLAGMRLVVWTHGTFWQITRENQELLKSFTELVRVNMECQTLAMATTVVVLNAYIQNWVTRRLQPSLTQRLHRGIQGLDGNPRHSAATEWSIVPNIQQPSSVTAAPAAGRLEPNALKCIVFFGKISLRKGIGIFLDAMEWLQKQRVASGQPPFEIRVYGKPNSKEDETFLKDRIRNTNAWPQDINARPSHRDDLSTPDVLTDLVKMAHSVLVVIPSLMDFAPYTVLECLQHGLPVIASNVGGIPELFKGSPASRLFEPTADGIASAVQHIAAHGLAAASAAFSLEELQDKWRAELAARTTQPNQYVVPSAAQRAALRVCAVFSSYNRPDLLGAAVGSVTGQKFSGQLRVVVADDHSTAEGMNAVLNRLAADPAIRVFRGKKNVYLGAVRNEGVRLCEEYDDLFVFFDDDDLQQPDVLERYATAALLNPKVGVFSTLVDLVNDHSLNAEYKRRYLTLGQAPEVGMFANMLGSAQMAVRGWAFRALKGFSGLRAPCEDWEFLQRAAANAAASGGIMVVPVGGTLYYKDPSPAKPAADKGMLLSSSPAACFTRVAENAIPDLSLGMEIAYSWYLKKNDRW